MTHDRRTWTAAEIAELCALEPRKHNGIKAFAEKHDRSMGTVSAKLQALRAKGLAKDVPHSSPLVRPAA